MFLDLGTRLRPYEILARSIKWDCINASGAQRALLSGVASEWRVFQHQSARSVGEIASGYATPNWIREAISQLAPRSTCFQRRVG